MGGGRYRTIDRWDSQAAYDRFRADFAREYAELDRASEPLCEVERPISSGE
jgi:hypothetical protein